MTQVTVNAGNGAVRNLNPNAQQFSSSDSNHGTVLTGSMMPSEDSYVAYSDHGNFQHYMESRSPQTYSDESASMVTVHITDPPNSIVDHLGGAQFPSTIYAPMPDNDSAQMAETSAEVDREKIRTQLAYYFSEKNIVQDKFLLNNMDSEGYVPISVIANFKLLRSLTDDIKLITDVLKEIPSVEVNAEEKGVRSTIVKTNRPIGKRCIIILRDVPYDATQSEISELFENEQCPVRAVSCEGVLGSGKSDYWYVTFNSEEDAKNAFIYLTRDNVSIRGQKVLARMKAHSTPMSSVMPAKNSSALVSPPTQANVNNGGATSPPPSNQTAVGMYSSGNFSSQQQSPPVIAQQQPPQQPGNAITQYPSQMQHPYHPGPMFMQSPSNQTPSLGNLQTSTGAYRSPMHSSMNPTHVPAPYSTNNQPQHHQQIEHPNQIPAMRPMFSNYSSALGFDRLSWAQNTGSHQPNVQNSQPTVSFSSGVPSSAVAPYNGAIHPQSPYYSQNMMHHGFIYFPPQPYQNSDQYPPMPYNSNPRKTRPRDHQAVYKPRNPTRTIATRNLRPEGLPLTNDNPNELDYGPHSTPHSEGSSSPVPRGELSMSRSNDPIGVSTLANLTLQHPLNYPPNSMDPNMSAHERNSLHPNHEIDYTIKPNSHSIQQQGSPDVNQSEELISEAQNLGKYSAASSYSTATSNETAKIAPASYQPPLEQRKVHSAPSEQSINNTVNENQLQAQAANKKPTIRPTSTNDQQTASTIPPLMPLDNRTPANKTRPTLSQQQQSRTSQPQPQQQQSQSRTNPPNNHSNSSVPLSVSIPKGAPSTFNKQNSPQSPNPIQKNQSSGTGSTLQQVSSDNSGPPSYADMLKSKQGPLKQNESNKSTISPPNETNESSSSRAQSPAVHLKTDSVSTSGFVSSEMNGPTSLTSSDLSPTNPVDASNVPSSTFMNNDSNLARRNSSASDHNQQHHHHHQQQHSSSPSHQQYNSRGRGGRGGNHRYSNDRRPGSNNSSNRGGRGGGRRSMNNNNGGPNGPPPYPSRPSGARNNGRFFDRSRGGGSYHNSNQTVHRFTGNTGNAEPQVHHTE